MSNDEKIFLRQLKLAALVIILPLVITTTWSILNDYFGNRQFRENAKENTEAIEAIRKYYLPTEDFVKYFDNQAELIKANRENDLERIRKLEEEQNEIRKYLRDTRGANLTMK